VKITRVEVRNYRSAFGEDQAGGVAFDVVSGMNALIGPNNCGKSNLMRAVGLALAADDEVRFDRDRDMPGPFTFAVPWITLDLTFDSKSSSERTLVRYLEEYERSVKGDKGSTYADEYKARLAVSFPGNDRNGSRRVEQFIARGKGALRGDAQKLDKAIRQFRKCYRFVSIESGQSLESLLAGKFREILHTVIQEDLKDEFATAERRRNGYVEGLQDSLLNPLRDGIRAIVCELFPEITEVVLEPRVPSIGETLSDVEVRIRDVVETGLVDKGTGVRGGVMVAMLRYLAEHGKRSMVFAIEEPEAFLHPGAQEDLRDDLEKLATRPDVTLFVSTHSPFIVSRRPDAQVVALTKSGTGRTMISGCAAGNQPQASLLGGLFREAALADLLERSSMVPTSAKAVVITEGDGDIISLRLAASRAGRQELLTGLHFSAAGGATKAAVQALITRSQTARPVMVLLDGDQPGREARAQLTGSFGFQNKKDVTSYGELFPNEVDIEAEDLWPSPLLARFVEASGEQVVLKGKRRRKDGEWHYDIGQAAKTEMAAFLEAEVTAGDCGRWVELLELLRTRLGV
jgi:putative ATP-dependent endonuclease of OLD family